ncbi:xanthine dehydrogenase [Nocardia sp. ET3-3]|uniref:Xanthine dehydrogenase n=1 Tax=Nocardia terrae TaxID=2675851 RepID=A0A7K1UUV2_9NOCA|nr:XdhC/CoxI family protein [Nocardia terrae]MVU78147.1 xanthine dehydrogenase [Nocardia terrae]
MRDIAAQLLEWHEAGMDYALASVIGAGGSAPRPIGSALAVAADGTVIGNISGGVVEESVAELCRESLRTGRFARESFGYSDSDAFEVGSSCGGTIQVFVQSVTEANRDAVDKVLRAEGEAVALVRDLDSGAVMALGTWWSAGAELDEQVVAQAQAMLDAGQTAVRAVDCGVDAAPDGPSAISTVFVECHVPAPRLIVFGAIDLAAAVVRIGKFLGHHVTVCDPRAASATRDRFPEADEIVAEMPHLYLARTRVDARTALCVLTHDAKLDVPLLEVALRLPVAYVGAMGSRRTHEDRLQRLRAVGMSAAELARLRSPIGLDLSGHTLEETAVSIAAEIVAVRRGGTGLPLGAYGGLLHRDVIAVPEVTVPDYPDGLYVTL